MNVREKEEECGQVVLKKIIDLGRKKVERVVTANKQSSNNSKNKGHWRHKKRDADNRHTKKDGGGVVLKG